LSVSERSGRLPARHRRWWWLLVIVLVGAALRIYALGDDAFWLDEAHSAAYTRLGVGDLWSFDRPFDRSNPPGYILLLKIWVQVSGSDEWFRASSVLAGVATLPVLYVTGVRLGNGRAGLIAAGYLAVNGFHVRYSQEARAYTLLVLLAAVAFLSIAQLMAEPDGDTATRVRGERPWRQKEVGQGLRRPVTWTDLAWFGYATSIGTALHLHNTALVMPLASNLAVAIWWWRWRRGDGRFARNWLLANTAAFLIWLPWVPGFLAQLRLVTDSWWVPDPTFRIVLAAGANLVAGFVDELFSAAVETWARLAVVVAVGAVVWAGSRRIDRPFRPLLWSYLLLLPVVELLYSLRRPIFLQRTLLWMLVPVALGVGFALAGRVSPTRLATGAFLVIVGVASTVGYHTGFEKTEWDRAASFVGERVRDRAVAFVAPGNTIVAFDHYFDRLEIDLDEYPLPNGIPNRPSRGDTLTEADVDAIGELVRSYPDVFLVVNGRNDGLGALPAELDRRAVEREEFQGFDILVVHYVLVR
jgi:4-amino-4-deoxy-L-arabinose transferase-like glycosyltransferase